MCVWGGGGGGGYNWSGSSSQAWTLVCCWVGEEGGVREEKGGSPTHPSLPPSTSSVWLSPRIGNRPPENKIVPTLLWLRVAGRRCCGAIYGEEYFTMFEFSDCADPCRIRIM